MRQKIASITQALRLPSVCVLCSQYHREPYAVCTHCTSLIKAIGPRCQHCAMPLPDESFPVCGICIKKRPKLDRVYTAYCFEEPLRTLIHEFKYSQGFYLRSMLVQLILDALTPDALNTECLIPVPLHKKRLQERGFNQAAILAKFLSKKTKRPYQLNLCEKMIHTKPQAGLEAKERQQNLTNAFQAQSTPFKHITLIDDLLTTGSTANELAHTFKAKGVIRVDLWCCARVI